ncbi:hypothetical protein O6H91_01G135900 [Diphasiastrum complanatum]|uniref:Uncharacterized protein n=1 Tax=Diphasiastrum complanatum TaxID=34168 RepID=A0ACC2EWG6_DIPCM|nr:hypothetical protein O6H91_01G135900 [Diphasiastrum complanatum]
MVGVSFKIDKIGKRYVPKLKPLQNGQKSRMAVMPVERVEVEGATLDSGSYKSEKDSLAGATDHLATSILKKNTKLTFEEVHDDSEYEASFAVNLFQDGFSLGKPAEKGIIPTAYEVLQPLYPYDRTSESFLTAIDWSQLPGDMLNGIPCKYIDGCVVCEVRDFRRSAPGIVNENMTACSDWRPVVHKVTLRPTTESIVKDIAAMAEDNWTYQDFLEIEARILNSVQPSLCLDPSPDIATQAYVSNYNKSFTQLKLNCVRPATRRYRLKGPGLDRKIRLAAARALMKADNLVKRRHSLPDMLDDMCQDNTGADRKNDSYIENSIAAEDHLNYAGHVLGSSVVQEPLRAVISGQPQTFVSQATSYHNEVSGPEILHGLPIPAGQISSSLGITIPTPPATSSLLTSTPDSTGGADARPMGLSGLGKQDSKDLLSTRKSEPRKLKPEPDKSEKVQLQQTLFQRAESKGLCTDRNQFVLQFKPESQQLLQPSPSHKERTSEELAQVEMKMPSHTELNEMCNVKSEAQENDRFYHQPDDNEKYQQEDKRTEVDQSQQMPQQNLQHSFGKLQPSSQQWQSIGLPSLQHDPRFERHDSKDDNRKKDEVAQKRKLIQNIVLPKPDNRLMQLPTALRSPQIMQPSSPSTAFGAVSTNSGDLSVSASVALSSPTGSVTMRDKYQSSQVMPLTLTTTGMLDQSIHMSQMQPSNIHLSRRRTNSLPKSGPGSAAAILPSNASTSMPSAVVNSPSNGTTPTTVGAKVEQGSTGQGQIKQPVDVLKSLVSCMQRHGKHIKEQKSEDLPPVNKTRPSWQLLSLALSDTSDDYKELKGQRSLANSLVGGNINARKTRFLQFTRTEPLYPGPNYSVMYHRTRLRLVLCGRGKDAMVEAVIQIGDDQDDEVPNTGPPYIVLPALTNAEVADLFAKQFAILLEREGFELVEDQVQPFARGNTMNTVASTPHQLPTGGPSSLGASLAQLGSPRMMVNQNMSTISDNLMSSLTQMQLPSPNALGGVRLPPQGMPQNRQLSVNYLNQTGTQGSSKPLQQLDTGTSQLAAVQQHQQLQRPSQLLAASQLATQLGATTHNPGQQLPQMAIPADQLQQFQLLQRQSLLQRKMLLPGGLGNLRNMNNMSSMGIPVSGVQGGIGSMIGGINGMNNVAAMAGMNNIAASIGSMSNLGNIGQLSNMGAIGQNSGVANMINQQIRPGTMNQVQAAAALQSKSRMAPVKIRPLGTASPPVRNNVENISGMTATNQVHVSGGVNMMSPSLGRGNLIPMQRAAVPGMGPPRVPAASSIAGQGYYSNSQQLNSQQLNSQQLSNNQISSPQLNTHHLSSQQLSSQQISPQSLSVGGLGSLVGGPQSPQLSSQTLGSVGSLTSSPMDLQNTNRVGSLTSAAGQGRTPISQPQTGQS